MAVIAAFLFLLLSCISAKSSPRLKLDLRGEIKDRIKFGSNEDYTVTLREGSTVYVGGNAILYRIKFGEPRPIEKISVPADDKSTEKCTKATLGYCENVIMVLQRFNATHILLCGTNAQDPRCWLLFDNAIQVIINGHGRPLGKGVCSFTRKQGVTSLVEGGRLYSAAPLYNGDRVRLRGYKKENDTLWLHSVDKWLDDPKFVGISPLADQVYMFFREKNSAENADIDPWISRIGRLCKDDRGGSRQLLHNKWATFLKARLLCNIPFDNVHFNRIKDVFIARSFNESEDRVYGIFNSNWNGTAICVYSMKDINDVFRTSAFKGFTEAIPNPRPGTCVRDSQRLPDKVLSVVENYPEMETQIHPIEQIPLLIKNEDSFTKIVVDSVLGIDGTVSRVLYLATGDDKIQKVLEANHSTFTISELEVLKEPGPILSMSLDSETKLLYITTAKELVRFPLAQCEKYNKSCESCVMARDPYCAWNAAKKECVPISSDFRYLIQNLEDGDFTKCSPGKVERLHSSQRGSEDTAPFFPLEGHGPVYLPCPKQSYHADYSWTVNDKVLRCSLNEDDCLLFVNDLSEAIAGDYKCTSNEEGHELLHASYRIHNTGSSVYLSRYSVALYSVLITVAALLLH
ncbi:semaphorin-7A-like [Heterodontus francisci]|uniref:semaphorin-7A-like n=1 Tax=Heterodontus francisci TaxID=7792 RepID=UPI00355B632F